ncbi:Cupin superfamily protein [Asanoa hainanensis]|uniref:Cupin superfamily protein n=1 Tax=Asanoa hainanensis TaxID=560556 RepID=A0A239NX67_9ACTN|nr:cupin domain-containing protein [Asanoa hainanensis]SNT58954.1 Cupin superfamily protein [Asanoa hainanensis]
MPEGAAADGVVPGGARRPAFARCVSVDAAKFAGAYWGRAPLLSRASELDGADGFRDLLSPSDADELLSRRGLRVPFLRVAKDGALVPPGRYTGGGGAGAEIDDQIIDEKIMALYAEGATLVFQGLHRTWPPLIAFAGELGSALGQPLQINAYLTPAGNQGFSTHYDTHDVFVLQVDGRKRWRVHPPVLADPLERQAWGGRAEEVSATAAGEPALDVVLEPGDALYLPRGWLHSAAAQDDSSLHITIGIRALTRYALVEALLAEAAEDPRLRATLPYALDVSDQDQLEPELTETVEALRSWLETASPAAVAERLRRRSWPAARPAPLRPLAQAAALSSLAADSHIVPRRGLRWRLEPDGTEKLRLRLTDRAVTFPAGCTAALTAFLDGSVTRVGDLPGLDDEESCLVLARRLLREAVAVPG